MDESDPCVIIFKTLINCVPLTNYIIDISSNIITYYCGNNNTIIYPYSYIESIIINSN
jgi:hypothetical protein